MITRERGERGSPSRMACLLTRCWQSDSARARTRRPCVSAGETQAAPPCSARRQSAVDGGVARARRSVVSRARPSQPHNSHRVAHSTHLKSYLPFWKCNVVPRTGAWLAGRSGSLAASSGVVRGYHCRIVVTIARDSATLRYMRRSLAQ